MKKILVIEDAESINTLIRSMIHSHFPELDCKICTNLNEAEKLISDGYEFDIVVLDLALQNETGLTFLKSHPELTMIITTAMSDNTIQREARKYTNLIEYYLKPLNYSKLFKDISNMTNLDILKKLTNNLNLRDAQLRESEERYSIAFMSSPYAIIITRPTDGYIIDVNNAFTIISEYTREETIGNSSIGLGLWADKTDREWAVSELLHGKKIISEEINFKKKSGVIFTGLYSAQIIHIKGITHILSSIDDITEQRLAEKQLCDVIEKNPISIQIVDKNGYTIKVNPAHTKLFGVLPPGDFSIFDDLIKKYPSIENLIVRARNGEVINFPDICYNIHDIDKNFPDIPIWIRAVIFPLVDTNSELDKFVIMHENITDRKITEEALLFSEIRYRRLFEAARDGILILNAETGMIDDVNPYLVEMLGYTHKEFLGKAIWEIGIFKDMCKNKDKFLELQQKEYVRYENLPLVTLSGELLYVEFVSNVYLVDNKKVIQCNIRDITIRKQLEKIAGDKKNGK